MSHEEVQYGFGLRTGDSGNTANGAGNLRRPASQAQITGKNQGLAEPETCIFSLRYSTLAWAKRGRTVCSWVF